MNDVANGVSPSPLLTPGMNAAVTQEIRAETKQLLAGMSSLQFLACEKSSASDPYGAVQ